MYDIIELIGLLKDLMFC